MNKHCPQCGGSVKTVNGNFVFHKPENLGGDSIVIENSSWYECYECGEIFLTPELDDAIDRACHVVENPKEPRIYKFCKCSHCGDVSRCTPTNDFYSIPSDENALLCESCFRSFMFSKR